MIGVVWKMKIAIVTIYDGNNMGSFLQAVALKYILEDMGHSIYFVQRMTEEENLNLFLNRSFSRPRPFPLNILADIKRSIFNRMEDKKKRDEIKKIYDVLSIERNNLPILAPNRLEEIDLIICGSDEIWNFQNTSISVPFYTCLGYGRSIRKIAYAVSVGSSSEKDFINHPDIVNSICNFDKIFPRDTHSKNVLEKTLERPLEIVCDPTLLVDRKRLDQRGGRVIKGSYIMLYAYDLTKEEKIYLKKFSKDHNLPIISILHYSDIADQILVASPYEFANIIKHADYCYTSTFHGTIFCTIFAKRFAYKSRRIKVKQVGEYMNVQDREWVSGSYDVFRTLMETDIDRNVIDNTLSAIKIRNSRILKDIIDETN